MSCKVRCEDSRFKQVRKWEVESSKWNRFVIYHLLLTTRHILEKQVSDFPGSIDVETARSFEC